MKKQNKLQLILVLITFLIAVFFFGRWVNDVRPRWEWWERIYQSEDWSNDGKFCQLITLKETNCLFDEEITREEVNELLGGFSYFCGSVAKFDEVCIVSDRECDDVEYYRAEIISISERVCYDKGWVRVKKEE